MTKEKLQPLPPRMTKAELDAQGREILDPVPMAPPVGYVAGLTQEERLRQMIRSEHERLRAQMYEESFEEASDFDIEDDPIDPSTPYEEYYDAMDAEVRMRLRDDAWRRTFEARLKQARDEMGVKDADDVDKGRKDDNERRASGPDRESEPEPRKVEKTGVQEGVRERDRGVGKPTGKD